MREGRKEKKERNWMGAQPMRGTVAGQTATHTLAGSAGNAYPNRDVHEASLQA